MIRKEYVVIFITLLQMISYIIFLNGFFPLKKTLSGFAKKEDAPNVPGLSAKTVPGGKYDRVVIVVIDALRADFVFDTGKYYMPFLAKSIKNRNALAFSATVHPPTVTLPRIKALTTGGIPGFVDVVLNFGSSSLDEDNIVGQLVNAGKEVVFYGDDTWIKLFPDQFRRKEGTTSFFVTDYTEVDTNVSRHLPDELSRHDWDVMILHYLGLDHIGHLAGPNSPLVSPKLLEMDGVLHKIYQAMKQWDSDKGLQSLMMVCGDHGMSDQGGHGGSSQGEITVPVVFLSPNVHDVPVTQMDAPDEIMQIDVAPTLASLMGIPIPKNNLGQIVTQMLIGYRLEEKARLMQVNAHQVALLLAQNVEDIEKEKGHQLYEQTVRRHSEWLHETQEADLYTESWENVGHRILKDYERAVLRMRSRVSETSTFYDLYSMGAGITGIWLVMFMLLSLAFSENSSFTVTTNRLAICFICCIPVILGHMTICTSQLRSEFLCTANIFVLPVQLVIAGAVVMATLFSVMTKWNNSCRKPLTGIEWIFLVGTGLHTLSLLSSSFVEEEHQTWYFYITTLHLIFICILIGGVCSRSSQSNADIIDAHQPGQYDLTSDLTDKGDNGDFLKQRPVQDSRGKAQRMDTPSQLPDISVSRFALSMFGAIAVMVLCRVSRRWNQTGDKWQSVPDIGDWLVRPENKPQLSVTMVLSMTLLIFTRWRSSSLQQCFLYVVAMTTTYCFRAANGLVLLPGIYYGTTKGTLEAQLTYVTLFLLLTLSLRKWLRHKEDSHRRTTELLWSVQTIWLGLILLVLRPHNSALVAMVAMTESLVSNHILPVIRLRPAFLTVYCTWLGQAFFFFQGNSNSLTTVDVSAGYVGLVNYYPVLIGLLMCLSTYAMPIFWMISLFKYLYENGIDDQYKRHEIRTKNDHLSVAMTILASRGLPMAVYCVLVSVERYHLFVWTVFSPKLLFEGMLAVVMHVFVVIHAIVALINRRHSKVK